MATKSKLTLEVCCPHCLDGESLTLDLNDLFKVSCGACANEFTARQAAELARLLAERWLAVAAWIDAAPIVEK